MSFSVPHYITRDLVGSTIVEFFKKKTKKNLPHTHHCITIMFTVFPYTPLVPQLNENDM